jgi:hypothetical protein
VTGTTLAENPDSTSLALPSQSEPIMKLALHLALAGIDA